MSETKATDGPEITEAMRIANKHLAGASRERRMALAAEISAAMIQHGGGIARNIVEKMTTRLRADLGGSAHGR